MYRSGCVLAASIWLDIRDGEWSISQASAHRISEGIGGARFFFGRSPRSFKQSLSLYLEGAFSSSCLFFAFVPSQLFRVAPLDGTLNRRRQWRGKGSSSNFSPVRCADSDPARIVPPLETQFIYIHVPGQPSDQALAGCCFCCKHQIPPCSHLYPAPPRSAPPVLAFSFRAYLVDSIALIEHSVAYRASFYPFFTVFDYVAALLSFLAGALAHYNTTTSNDTRPSASLVEVYT